MDFHIVHSTVRLPYLNFLFAICDHILSSHHFAWIPWLFHQMHTLFKSTPWEEM